MRLPRVSLELRLLGTSHQVMLDIDGLERSETVACLPDRAGALPTREESRVGHLVSRFAARCVRLTPADLAARVPFLLLPVLGLTRGALMTGVVNALAGAAVVFGLFGRGLSRRDRFAVGASTLAVLAVLGVALAASTTLQRVARAQLYADPVVYAQTSQYQEIVLTRSAPFTAGPADTRLWGRTLRNPRGSRPAVSGPKMVFIVTTPCSLTSVTSVISATNRLRVPPNALWSRWRM
ncbi:MAG: DUF2617 family protein [Actinomycetota bacterium]|nr:DUF2617 family protein [Actinomycetota bacterium]